MRHYRGAPPPPLRHPTGARGSKRARVARSVARIPRRSELPLLLPLDQWP